MRGRELRIMNEENEWDQNVQADLVEGPVERVSGEEVVKALRKMKAGKAAGPSELSVEMTAASEEIRTDVMVELSQSVLDGRGMPEEWALSVVVPIFKGKGDAMNCGVWGTEGAREENAAYGESGQDAIWFYATQRLNRCSAHFKEVTRVLRQGEEVVYVLC